VNQEWARDLNLKGNLEEWTHLTGHLAVIPQAAICLLQKMILWEELWMELLPSNRKDHHQKVHLREKVLQQNLALICRKMPQMRQHLMTWVNTGMLKSGALIFYKCTTYKSGLGKNRINFPDSIKRFLSLYNIFFVINNYSIFKYY
jgi:hypothetical protein